MSSYIFADANFKVQLLENLATIISQNCIIMQHQRPILSSFQQDSTDSRWIERFVFPLEDRHAHLDLDQLVSEAIYSNARLVTMDLVCVVVTLMRRMPFVT